MRRKDREITDNTLIDEIIRQCDVCRLGFADGDGAYIVPMNFGFENSGGCRTFYFHSAPRGRKIQLIQRGSKVSFEMDTDHKVNSARQACGYSFRFKCVMGTGRISMLSGDDKIRALDKIMERYRDSSPWEYDKRTLRQTAVFSLAVEEISCKVHK